MLYQSITAFLASVGGVILVDLILSGDNALVIGAAASGIPRRRRGIVLLTGGAGAIILRVLFTAFATFLLSVPFLQAIGGLLVLYIAIQLVLNQEQQEDSDEASPETDKDTTDSLPRAARYLSRAMQKRAARKGRPDSGRFLIAIMTVVVADITMSLDNIVAIGALARGQVVILALGLVLSVAILLLGSALVAELMRKIPELIFFAAFILAWVSGDLILHDLSQLAGNREIYSVAVYLITFGLIAVFTSYALRRQYKQKQGIIWRLFHRPQ